MSLKSKNMIITVEEYFSLLKKDTLTPEEMVEMNSFQDYIKLCEKYEKYLSPAAESILSEYNQKRLELSTRENKSVEEQKVVTDYENSFKKKELEEIAVRKLTKAGYIDATIILAIILNIGFIIAINIIGRR